MHQGEVGISIGHAVYLLHIVMFPPLTVEYFLCEGGKHHFCLLVKLASSSKQQILSVHVLWGSGAMIYTIFTLLSFFLVISLGIGIAHSWWPLSCKHSGMRARPCDAMAGAEGKEGAGTASLHSYTFYISTMPKPHNPLKKDDFWGGS